MNEELALRAVEALEGIHTSFAVAVAVFLAWALYSSLRPGGKDE